MLSRQHQLKSQRNALKNEGNSEAKEGPTQHRKDARKKQVQGPNFKDVKETRRAKSGTSLRCLFRCMLHLQ